MNNMKICKNRYLYFVVIMLMTACKQNLINQEINLNVESSAYGLIFSIKGSAIDPDNKITILEAKWGDNKTEIFTGIDFSKIDINHKYSEPGTYNVFLTAVNDNKDSVSENLSVSVDFNETSLENIKPNLFKTSEKEYLILTINLHTYQEDNQNEKFNLIVDLIAKMDIDFITFQECAQYKNSSIVNGIIREDNMVKFISDKLKEKYNLDYNFVWNWAHYGWDVWEEGIAVLSKYPRLDSDERYISTTNNTSSINSRKVIYGSYQLSGGIINVFSAHTHWRTFLNDQEQNKQINNIKLMVEEKEALLTNVTSFVCGDFNGNPTSEYPWSEGYNTMMANNKYIDTFLKIYPDANNIPSQSIYYTVFGDFPGRIDYIFMKENLSYQVSASQIVFTSNVIGEVSDHFGVLTKIRDIQ